MPSLTMPAQVRRHRGPRDLPGPQRCLLGTVCLTLAMGLLAVPSPIGAQEIISAQVLDLMVLDVQVIVSGAHGDDQVQCLLRDQARGLVRVGGARSVSTGLASGHLTLLSIVLPLLKPHETEFAVALVRGNTILRRTEWRPLFGGTSTHGGALNPPDTP